jgi:hypothetical protein
MTLDAKLRWKEHIKKKRDELNIKNGVFWVVTPCGSCKNRRFGGTWRLLHQGDKNRRLLVAACVVPSAPIFVTLMKEAPGSSETSVLSRATRRNNPEDTILHSHRRENLKSYIVNINSPQEDYNINSVQTGSGSTQPLVQWIPGDVTPRVTQPEGKQLSTHRQLVRTSRKRLPLFPLVHSSSGHNAFPFLLLRNFQEEYGIET